MDNTRVPARALEARASVVLHPAVSLIALNDLARAAQMPYGIGLEGLTDAVSHEPSGL